MPAKSARTSSDESYKARIGDAALIEKSGKNWAQWFAILGKSGATKLNHAEISEILYAKYKVPRWWAQIVAVGYEQARGIRAQYESCNATFSANCSRTFACNVKEIFRACADGKIRKSWLTPDRLAVSKSNQDKNVRGAWDGESRLEIRFTPKGAGKTQITIDHMKLQDSASVEKMKAFWAKNLEKLREKVEKPAAAKSASAKN